MIGTRRALLWVALAIPAALMIQRFASGEALAMDLYHPSGEMAVRLMILALLPGPLVAATLHTRTSPRSSNEPSGVSVEDRILTAL